MSNLHVQGPGGAWDFPVTSTVTIGRDPGCDVTLVGPTVSRQHAQLRFDVGAWVFTDTGSSGGTYLNGTRVQEVRITGRTALRLGAVDGDELVLTPPAVTQRPGPPPAAPSFPGGAPANPAAGIPPGLAHTMMPGATPGPGLPGVPPGPGFATGPGLLVKVGSRSLRFPPATVVRIGRDPVNEVVIDDPAVSRLHGVVEGRPDGWWFVDRSSAGTFAEEDRVTQQRLEEPTTLMLGHPTAGAEVEIIPIVAAAQAQKTIAKKKRRRTLAIVGGVVAALVLLGGGIGAAVLLGGDDEPSPTGTTADPGLTSAELDRAKLASVLILAVDASGQVVGNGSGSIISEDGLILTNAHVADPDAPGLVPPGQEPAGYLIALVSEEDDTPAAPTYAAETIVSDGVLDLAVMQITTDADGVAVDPADLDLPEPLPLADSDELRTGDEITALGFPGIAHVATGEAFERRALTVTRGVVSTFLAQPPVDESRAWIDSDIRIGSGNSGGASINADGELVGINTAVVTEATVEGTGEGGSFTGGSARIRPGNFAADIIDIANEGGDPSYVSPFVEEMQEMPDPMEQAGATARSGGWSVDGAADCSTESTLQDPQFLSGVSLPATLYAHYAVEGLPDGTAFQIVLIDDDGNILGTLDGEWTLGSGEVCASVPIDVPRGLRVVNAAFVVGDSGVDNPVVLR